MSIKFEKLAYEYSPNTPFAHHALEDITLSIEENALTAIVGHTGSGKSTLVQHLNALLLPSEGKVHVFDHEIIAGEKPKGLKKLRSRVGLVFQFPEMQLFEETVYKDVSFGPKNFGFSEEEINRNVQEALGLVGIDSSLWERSPLDLSGGQKRRVAIAGVLASAPDVIVLDEPTAGLDPQGSKDMMKLFEKLKKEHHKTIIMVTHDMEQVYDYADYVAYLESGKLKYYGDPQTFFDDIENDDFVLPKMLYVQKLLKEHGLDLHLAKDVDDLASNIKEALLK